MQNQNIREIIQISQSIHQQLKTDKIPFDDFAIYDYTVNGRKNQSTLTVSIKQENNLYTYDIDTNLLSNKDKITQDLVNKWIDKDLYSTFLTKDLSKVNTINDVIEDLLEKIDDEIYRSIIKQNLIDISSTFECDPSELSEYEIYKKFTEATLNIGKNSIKDSLTGMYSQKFFLETLQGKRGKDAEQTDHILKSIQEKSPNEGIAYAFIDINIFHEINKVCGMKIGDKALKVLAEDIHNTIEDKGIAVRRGGDEFVVIAPKSKIKELIKNSLDIQKINQNTKKAGIDPKNLKLSVSIGAKTLQINSKKSTELIAELDSLTDKEVIHAKNLSRTHIGTSRDKAPEKEEYEASKHRLMKNLNQELGIDTLNLYSKETLSFQNNQTITQTDDDILSQYVNQSNQTTQLKL